MHSRSRWRPPVVRACCSSRTPREPSGAVQRALALADAFDGELIIGGVSRRNLRSQLVLTPQCGFGPVETGEPCHTWRGGFVSVVSRAARQLDAELLVVAATDGFLETLGALESAPPTSIEHSPCELLDAALAPVRSAEHLLLLLDYDGTLVPFHRAPDLALPDQPLLELPGRPRPPGAQRRARRQRKITRRARRLVRGAAALAACGAWAGVAAVGRARVVARCAAADRLA